MDEYWNQIDKILALLEKYPAFQKLEECKQAMDEDAFLNAKIKEYHETLEESLRLEIYQYPVFKEYKRRENDIFWLLLQINRRLETLAKKKGCIK